LWLEILRLNRRMTIFILNSNGNTHPSLFLATCCVPAYNHSMRQYERYLFMHLLWPTVVITASLTAIVWLTQILKFLEFMLSRGLSLGDFLFLIGLMLPSLLLVLVPISLAIAVIYTYNRLTSESELIVLNAVGVSKWQLAKPTLMMGLVCAAFCYALAIYVMPRANEKFQDIRVFFRDKYASVLLEEEVFNTPMDGMTVFVRERDSNNNLSGILLYDNRDRSQNITMIAQRGRVEQTEAGPRFHLSDGMRQQWRNGMVSWLKFDNYTIDIAFYGEDVARKRNANERTLWQLFNPEGLTEKQQAAYRAEAHQRLTWPLFALTLPLVALAVLFTSEFNRRGQWRRVMVASICMALVVMLYFTVRSASLKQPLLLVGMYALTLGLGFVCAQIIRRGWVLRFARARNMSPKATANGGAS
jgi:lipopolysaccharide export system permease protein